MHQVLASLLIAIYLGVSACAPPVPHNDPMQGWQEVRTFAEPFYKTVPIPKTIRQDVQAFIRTLSGQEKYDTEADFNELYWEDGTGQHAVVFNVPHDGEHWHYALIYDRNNRRVKVLKYSTGSYMS